MCLSFILHFAKKNPQKTNKRIVYQLLQYSIQTFSNLKIRDN